MSSAINALLTAGVGEGLFDIVTRQAHAEIAGYYADSEDAVQHFFFGVLFVLCRFFVFLQLLAPAGRRQRTSAPMRACRFRWSAIRPSSRRFRADGHGPV